MSASMKGRVAWNKGLKTPMEIREKLSIALKKNPARYWLGKKREDMSGPNNPNYNPQRTSCIICGTGFPKTIRGGRVQKCCSIECRNKHTKGRPAPWAAGEKSHFWRGGVSSVNQVIRHSAEYRLWRESVFRRDNFTCQSCNKHGGKLNADHIKPFSLFPELRFAIDNGLTLCVPCHRETPTFGNFLKSNKKYHG